MVSEWHNWSTTQMTLDSGSMISLKLHWWPSRSLKLQNAATIAWTAKMVVRTLRRRSEWKIEDVLEKDQFGFGNGKTNMDGIGILRIISVWTLDIDEELCTCFIDWQNAFDRVNRTKLIQILLGNISTGDKREWFANRTRISAKHEWIKDRQDVRRMDEELHKDAVSHW